MWMRSTSFRSTSANFDGVALPSFRQIVRQAFEGIGRWLSAPIKCSPRITVLVVEWGLVLFSFNANLYLFGELPNHAGWIAGAGILIPFVLLLRGCGLLAFGVWRRSFRYASVADMVAIAEAVGTSSMALYMVYRLLQLQMSISVPGAVFVADGITAFLLLCSLHFSVRLYKYKRDCASIKSANCKRVILVGAGDAGASVVHELVSGLAGDICPVAFVDDDPAKEGLRICGVPVAGNLTKLSEIVFKYSASEVLVCIPSAIPKQMHRILNACLESGISVRTLPGVSELVNGRASWREMRSIRIEDVLQREQSVSDSSLTNNLVRDRVVVVTGAGGSIGSELCRQIAAAKPRELILLDKSENNLFYIHSSIAEVFPGIELTPLLADVSDPYRVQELFRQHHPELVFHAAAFKHVGMMELHPDQAIRNNVLGTRNVLQSAVNAGVKAFVNISTDKAVNPRNYMGVSKKLTELLVKAYAAEYGLPCMSVRFGNVAGSSGSVLRIFSERITNGQPLKVTDPQATRYFMSIPEAVYLILCAATLGHGGETFILDMGAPVNIYELARAVSLFSGIVPGEDLPIEFTGLRRGEKIHEELWEDWERPQPTLHPQIFQLKGTDPLSIDILKSVPQFEEYLTAHNQPGLLQYIAQLLPHVGVDCSSFASFQGQSTPHGSAGTVL